jgi:EmrB/QacA subfamily drug resistance transporter
MARPGLSETQLGGGTYIALAAMAMGVFIVANDITALSVALPSIEKRFDADVSTVQWVINAYALVFGVLIVTGGRLADVAGRRRVFFLGAAIFGVFSVLGGVAQNVAWLIACRALMGAGGALMWPAVLGMTYGLLPESRQGLAGGLIIGAAGFGNAAGPLLGGLLTDALSWRWILFVNAPIALGACLVTARAVRESRGEPQERRFDYAGTVALSLGLVALLIALDQVTDWGWDDARVAGLFAAFLVLLAAFAVRERRAGPAALVPPDVMRNGDFVAACLATLLMSASFFAALLYLPQFLQKILGWSPLGAGAGLLPLMAVFAAVSFGAGPLYERLGPKVVVSAGALGICVGTFLVSLAGAHSGFGPLIPGMVVLGVGVGLFYSAVTTAAVSAVDPARASLASGIVYMFQIAGGSIGLGLTTTLFTTAATDSVQGSPIAGALPAGQVGDVQGILAGTRSARTVLGHLSSTGGERVFDVVRDAFASGMHWGFRFVAALALTGLLVSVLRVGGRLRPAPAGREPR